MNKISVTHIKWKKWSKWQLWLAVAIVLYLAALVNSHFLAYNANLSRVKSSLESALRKKESIFYKFVNDGLHVRQVAKNTDDPSSAVDLSIEDLPIGIFVYKLNDIGNPLLVFWNNSRLDVNESILRQGDGAYAVSNNKGFFEQINNTLYVGTDIYRVIGVIPVYWEYPQTSNLLKSQFDGYPNLGQRYKIANTGTPIVNETGQVLYHIEPADSDSIYKLDTLSLVLKISALLIALTLIDRYARRVVVRRGFYAGFGILSGVVLGARLLSYYIAFPFTFRMYELFDPLIYATSWLHRSLGDLVVNMLLLWWLTSFVRKNVTSLQRTPFSQRLWRYSNSIAVACLVLLTVATIEFVRLIRSLVMDSQVSFNVTNFFSMDKYTVVCFVALSIFIWCYVQLCQLCLWPSKSLGYSLFLRTIIIALTGIVLGLVLSNADTVESDFLATIWLIVFAAICDQSWHKFRKEFVVSPIFLSFVLFLSASLSIVIYTEYRQLELKYREFFAENLSMRSDETGEILLHMAINSFNSYFLQNGIKTLYNQNQNAAVKYKITNDYFSGYLNRYRTSIYTYDSLKRPLFNTDGTTFETLQNNIQMLGKHTDIADLYYNDSKPDQFSYIYRKKMQNVVDSMTAYAFILVRPLRYSDNQLDVRLFNTSKSLPGDINNDYSYAIYYNNKLVTSYLDGGYSATIKPPNFMSSYFLEEHTTQGSKLWFKAGDKKVIVVVKQMNVWLDFVTLFAYIFCSAIIAICLGYLLIYFVFTGFNVRYLKRILRLTINRRMQGTIIFLSLFAFLVVSISTVTFFLAQFRETNKVKLSKSARIVSMETENSIKNDLLEEIDDDSFANENTSLDDFAKKVLQIAALNNLDINYYNMDGTLMASTQPTIYGNGFFNSLMNPKAFFMLRNRDRLEYTDDEQIGNFKFSSIYFPLQDAQGNDIAYLNIPYLNSQNEVRQQISSFLVTIINLNALIFILAGFMALRLTRQITTAFAIVEKKMKFLNLTGKNEPINYKRSDEIGALVQGYNTMLQKLSESVEALAKSEREEAWQEMARQVAHEIKNPLTPMKLSIQYLGKAIASGAPNAAELSQNVTRTLIDQIDQLAKIAGDFSQFANISNTNPVAMNLKNSLRSIVNLYKTDETLDITLETPPQDAIIVADQMQVNRVLTNLVKNALEASSDSLEKCIHIRQTVEGRHTIVSIKDHGSGIPDDMKDKIFVPNFTTKSSGTGLGLAICKGICERAGGSIYFESEVGVGTTFYVKFPLMDKAHED
ncbi:MAG: HAMP domain-containing sensor histidine kinase [Chitinophagaceae bacterium]